MTKEEFFKEIQKIMAANPVVVVGSGTSISYGIPGMGKLAKDLKEYFENNPYTDSNLQRIVEDFLCLLNRGMGLEEALLSIKVPDEVEETIVKCVWNIISNADKKVYERFISGEEMDMKNLFDYMIYDVPKKVINIVSTNYDKIVEYAASQTSAYINNGFTIGMCGMLKEKILENPFKPEQDYVGFINILKVHGSLDWFKKGNEVFCYPNVGKIPQGFVPCIITPGTNKYEKTQQEPHRQLLSSVDKVFGQASGYLCLGYGFNDQHVHPMLLKNAQKHRTKILIVTKDITTSIRDNVINKGYDFISVSSDGNNGTEFCSQTDSVTVPNEEFWSVKGFEKIYK